MGLKKFFVVIAISMASVIAFASRPGTSVGGTVAYPDPVIPLLEPLPFPWETIEGVWQGRRGNSIVWFSLQVRSDSGGRKFLRVLEIDPVSDAVVAQGNGIVDENTEAVRAGMVGGRGSYMLYVGLYRNEKVAGYPNIVTMATARDFQGLTPIFSIMLQKIQPCPVELSATRGMY